MSVLTPEEIAAIRALPPPPPEVCVEIARILGPLILSASGDSAAALQPGRRFGTPARCAGQRSPG
jgi:hypothetical protein